MYAARKRRRNQASPLPDLPDSMFGWIPALWSITDQQVLASAGLDAYVVCNAKSPIRRNKLTNYDQFLRFFKMALKFLTVTLFFALVVFKPVHDAFPEGSPASNSTDKADAFYKGSQILELHSQDGFHATKKHSFYENVSTDYLWMYLIFAYLFSALAIYLLVSETVRIIDIRQEYLGNQATVTDRTIRLSGVPPELRSEEKIKHFIEELEIGKVDSVMLCMIWQELDDEMTKRATILRRLEESWTIFNGQKAAKGESTEADGSGMPPYTDEPTDAESGQESSGQQQGDVLWPHDRRRPKATVRYGILNLQSRYVDAIELYEEQLRETDEKIAELRKKSFEPTPLAFVTMDSVAACVSTFKGASGTFD